MEKLSKNKVRSCAECVYYGDGKCAVVVWAEGIQVRLDPANLNGHCDMFERNVAETGTVSDEGRNCSCGSGD